MHRKAEYYSKESVHRCHDIKLTLILAVAPDGFKHARLRQVAGTTGDDFWQFTDGILARIPAVPARVFMWDNLRSHYSGQVAHNVYEAGHSILPRPAYSPCDGPIEYMFNHIERQLQLRMYDIRNIICYATHAHQ